MLVQWKSCYLAIARYLSILTTRPVTLQQEFPSPLWYPLTSCCGAVRGQQKHTRTHTLAHLYSHTCVCAHPQLWTCRHSHFAEMGTPCRLGFTPQKPRYIHLRHSVRSYFAQKKETKKKNLHACKWVLITWIWNLITFVFLNTVFQHRQQQIFIFIWWVFVFKSQASKTPHTLCAFHLWLVHSVRSSQ